MKEKINQKGFIQIPILIAIVSIIAVLTVTTGVVLHKQGKLTPFIASFSQVFQKTEEVEPEIKPKESKMEQEQPLLEEPNKEEGFQTAQQLEQAELKVRKVNQEVEEAKTEAEKLIQEAEAIKRKNEEESLKKQQEAQKLTEEKEREEAILRVEKCKSEYTANKEKMVTEFNNYELPLKELGVKMALQTSLDNCVDECLNLLKESLGSYYPPSALSLCNYCKQTYSAMVSKTLEAIKSSKYNDIEQQFQLEYQQCLEK